MQERGKISDFQILPTEISKMLNKWLKSNENLLKTANSMREYSVQSRKHKYIN